MRPYFGTLIPVVLHRNAELRNAILATVKESRGGEGKVVVWLLPVSELSAPFLMREYLIDDVWDVNEEQRQPSVVQV
jgi:hypothetical protein